MTAVLIGAVQTLLEAIGLSLSVRTVEAHLRTIYYKLNVATRTEVTRFAIENHVV